MKNFRSIKVLLSLSLVVLLSAGFYGCAGSGSSADDESFLCQGASCEADNSEDENDEQTESNDTTDEGDFQDSGDQSSSGSEDEGEEEPLEEATTFNLTYYWIEFEADYEGNCSGALDEKLYIYDFDTESISFVEACEDFVTNVSMEGTGLLDDGGVGFLDNRLVNLYGDCPGDPSKRCFFVIEDTLGRDEYTYGAGFYDEVLHYSHPLTPFSTVAVDPDVIPIGTKIYVEELDGALMPDVSGIWGQSFVHDGCVVAQDEGGSINDYDMDFFSLTRADYLAIDLSLGEISEVTGYIDSSKCQ